MNSHDKDHAKMSYEEFCASRYNYLFVELLRRGWTEKKLAKAYDSAIAAWQHDGFEGKPPLKLVLEALLDGIEDEEILFRSKWTPKCRIGQNLFRSLSAGTRPVAA